MKILEKKLKQGVVKVKTENLDDLWYLSNIIEEGDVARSKTERKIKLGGENERNQKVVRRYVWLTLEVDKVEFHKHSNVLRVKGKIIQAPDEVDQGSYHTFNVDENYTITIQKEKWPKYLLEKLNEASQRVGKNVLLVCHNREEATFGLLTQRGLEVLSEIKGEVEKKRVENQAKGNFYQDVASALENYDEKFEPSQIVVASPGFWKEYLMKELSEGLKEKVFQASCSVVGERGLKEVVNRPELKKVLEKDRTRKEAGLLDEITEAISKDKACYGFEDCKEKVEIGSVEKLAVSNNYVVKMREEEDYEKVDELMKQCENMSGEVHLISSEEEANKLDNLGGVAGVLRWEA